jgi:protein-tyrosine phosphatase
LLRSAEGTRTRSRCVRRSTSSIAVTGVLFVCMGNICRSPAAEGVFRKLVAAAGREAEFDIDSAGTIGYHAGSPADSRMRATAEIRGYPLDSIARRIERDDFFHFDLIVTMDDENFQNVSALDPGRRAKVVRMCDYCEVHEETEVPDPYYGGAAGFERVLDILEDACANLLRRL